MKKRFIYIASLCFAMTVFPGCQDYLQEAPLDAPATGEFFNNQTEMNGGLNAVYKSVYWNFGNTAYQSVMDGWTDIAILRAPELGEGNFDAFNQHSSGIWRMAYTTIQRANTMLEGMEQGKANVPEAAYNRMQAETRVLRAWAYHYLLFMFGEAPLITKPLLPAEFYTQVRSPKAELLQFIYSELDAAIPLLDYAPSQRGRVSKAVALGLKARTALFNKEYQLAEESTKLIIDNAGLSLNPKFQDLFTKSGQEPNAGKEIMWEILYSNAEVANQNWVPLGSISRTAGGQSGRFPQQRLVDMFEARDGKRIDQSVVYNPNNPRVNRDRRLKYTVAIPGDTLSMNLRSFVYDVYKNTTSIQNAAGAWAPGTNVDFDNAFGPAKSGVGLLHAKYTQTNENAFASYVNYILMRYAEVLLIYAEAKIEQNELDATVVTALNKVRQRAGQPVVETAIQNDQQKLRQLVRRERVAELAMEGFRWFDIRRWDIAAVVMPQQIVGISKNPVNMAPTPSFTTSPVHDLNSIPVYTGQLTPGSELRFYRENRFWNPKLMLLPVPQAERDINTRLSQNLGW